MILPKGPRQKLKNQRGQILILFLLILVVGLAVVLSIASRTVTDVRITTTSDESNRAYFAAEAGVEEALKQISSGSTSALALDFSGLNDSVANVDINADLPTATFVYPTEIPKDGVGQIILINPYSPPTQATLAGATSWSGSSLEFFWRDPADIEISVIYATAGGLITGPDYISKIVYGPSGLGCSGASISPQTFSTTGFSFDANRTATLNIFGSSEVCGSLDQPSGSKPVVARVRTLNAATPLAVTAVGEDLPAQGFTIDSSGNTPSGVTRKLEVTRLYPSVPSLFDYVLFNGGSDLEK